MKTCVQSLQNNCIICNVSFELKSKRHPNQKYCSSYCIKKAWTIRNPIKNAEAKKAWTKENPEKRRIASAKFQKENRAYYTQYASLRSRHLKQAKVKCLTEFDELYLEEFYDLAKRRGLEVDHIIPLKHPNVCGLHVPENLQMLTRSQNAQKSNRFNEDVVAVITE